MGCSGSTANTKKPQGGIRRKKTAIKKSGQAQARSSNAPIKHAPVATQNGKMEDRKVTKEQTATVNSASKPVSSGTAQVNEGPVKKPTAPIVVSDNYNKDDIESIAKSYQGKDDKKVCGERHESIILFNKDVYETTGWSPVLFAIYNRDLRAVRYFIEHQRYHRRLSTRKRIPGPDETHYDAEAFPLIIAISNQDEAMLDYLWSMNELWDYEHLKVVLQVIFTRNLWAAGMKILLGSEATQDIYNSLSFTEKKQFMLELFYRYLHYAPEDIKGFIKNVSVSSPYSLVALYYLMTEEKVDEDLIHKALQEIYLEDYVKMKYEAEKEFLDAWYNTLNTFKGKADEYEHAVTEVDK